MANAKGAIRGAGGGAIKGALIGTYLLPGLGTAAGAAIMGAFEGITGLFSDDPEEERQKRKAELIARINEAQARSVERVGKMWQKQTATRAATARAGAAARARARGLDVSRSVDVAEARGLAGTTEPFVNAIERINQDYERARMEAEFGFADRPIEPGMFDTISAIGEDAATAAMQFKALKDAQEYQKALMGGGSTSTGVIDEGNTDRIGFPSVPGVTVPDPTGRSEDYSQPPVQDENELASMQIDPLEKVLGSQRGPRRGFYGRGFDYGQFLG